MNPKILNWQQTKKRDFRVGNNKENYGQRTIGEMDATMRQTSDDEVQLSYDGMITIMMYTRKRLTWKRHLKKMIRIKIRY